MSLISQVAALKEAKALRETVKKDIKRAFRGKMDVRLDIDESSGVISIRLGKDQISMTAIAEACEALQCPLENVVVANVRDDVGMDWLALQVTLVADTGEDEQK
jgi:hypothetical protein